MKTDRVFLHLWKGKPDDEYLDIPWPAVHKAAGVDLINWINSQDPISVQMILEQEHSGWQSLWAEFYNDLIRTEFALRFAK
jgi:hypothetical protein